MKGDKNLWNEFIDAKIEVYQLLIETASEHTCSSIVINELDSKINQLFFEASKKLQAYIRSIGEKDKEESDYWWAEVTFLQRCMVRHINWITITQDNINSWTKEIQALHGLKRETEKGIERSNSKLCDEDTRGQTA